MQQEQAAKLQLDSLEGDIKRFLDKDALIRFGNIKAANPAKAQRITLVLAQLSGRLNGPVSDEQFKDLLRHMEPKKKDIKITRK